MAEEKKVEEQKELTTQEKLAQVNMQLNNLKATEAACAEILKDKNIKIVNVADESEEPLSLNITGNAVTAVVRPIVQGVTQNKDQLIAIKEQLLAIREQEMTEAK
jgi:hypothetical protein